MQLRLPRHRNDAIFPRHRRTRKTTKLGQPLPSWKHPQCSSIANLYVPTPPKQHLTTSHNSDEFQHLHSVQTPVQRRMSSSAPCRGSIAPRGKKEEVEADPPRGRTPAPDSTSASHQGRDKRADSRSVSRGRTHKRSRDEPDRRAAIHLPEAFVYPSPAGGFAPKGRAPTVSEAAYLSDAPHLDYKASIPGKKGAGGAVRSPKASHIRMMEMEAWAEMTGAGGGAAETRKGNKEETEKGEEH